MTELWFKNDFSTFKIDITASVNVTKKPKNLQLTDLLSGTQNLQKIYGNLIKSKIPKICRFSVEFPNNFRSTYTHMSRYLYLLLEIQGKCTDWLNNGDLCTFIFTLFVLIYVALYIYWASIRWYIPYQIAQSCPSLN